MKIPLAVVAATMLGACAAPNNVVRGFTYPFDSEQARSLLEAGANTISGSALIRQQGGGVVTCAGQDVHLIPATQYAERRMDAIYGGRKYLPVGSGKTFEPDQPAYYQLTRTTRCNAQGFFRFDKLADGDFFVQTVVSWTAGTYNIPQGGGLMQRVTVRGGQSVEVVLAP